MTKGIYIIKNKHNDKVYVGSSDDIETRYYMHLNLLRRGKSYKKLQSDYDQFGEGSFYYEVLEVVDNNKCLKEREDYYIDKYDSIYNGYNTKRNIPLETKSVSIPLSVDDYNFIDEYCDSNNVNKTKFLSDILKKGLQEVK